MKYVALLRGINVGGNKKVDMKQLKKLFESINCTQVSTYLNSGNVLFSSNKTQQQLQLLIPEEIEKEFYFKVNTLIKPQEDMIRIAKKVPKEWKNNAEQKTDVAYLFAQIDSKKTIEELPIKSEFIDIRYTKGAIFWNIKKSEYNKSQLNKLAESKLYKLMTLRNINTARYLGQLTDQENK